ncbi:MAG: GNAT family N-acetyltransferase [Planctomycetia bacterium]|nr:GNAT family N-acetyltransferase [Planctomycetia bacterium]
MAVVEVRTFYLEMLAPPSFTVPPPRDGLLFIHAHRPTVAYYRFFYDVVGERWHWTGRKKLSDAEIAAILNDPKVEMHVMYCDGVPAGFAELDRRQEGQVEIVQFGLLPDFIGKGLGKFFLHWTVDKAWSYQPQRLWLHTCSLDHPAALPNYLKAGFTIYKEESAQQEI